VTADRYCFVTVTHLGTTVSATVGPSQVDYYWSLWAVWPEVGFLDQPAQAADFDFLFCAMDPLHAGAEAPYSVLFTILAFCFTSISLV
jgi:hypothetical protein